MLDDGILLLYTMENVAGDGMKPRYELKRKSRHFFGYETIGVQRHYAALAARSKISNLVKIWEDRDVEPTDICILEDGKQYKVTLVQHMRDEDGLRISKLTLERLEEEYVISEDI